MKWRGRRQSTNVDDRRDQGGGGGGGGAPMPSIGTLLMLWPLVKPLLRSKLGLAIIGVGAIAYFSGFGNLSGLMGGGAQQAVTPQQDDEWAAFAKTVHADLESVWADIYTQHGARYTPTTLVLYRGSTRSGCGPASARMGPFYCPLDQKVYVDLSFFEELQSDLGARGEFARAYVLAHEVGHHIQNLEGILDQVDRAKQQAMGKGGKNALQVKVELQADCYAGLWANHAHSKYNILEEGDLESALTAAMAIGDDRLQKQSQGFAIPHTFTHGSSKQRASWFAKGAQSGRLEDCNTFASN